MGRTFGGDKLPDSKCGQKKISGRPRAVSDMTHEAFGAWRKRLDLSQTTAAALLDVSQRSLRYYENGNPNRPGGIPQNVADKCIELERRANAGEILEGTGTYDKRGRPKN